MTESEIKSIVEKQRRFFNTGRTLDTAYRKAALKRLYSAIKAHEQDIADALMADLGKSGFETYMCETGLTLGEISHMIRHVRAYSGEKTVPTPLAQFAARSYIKPSPYGVTLIMSPWNYPLLLTLEPLADALAAGNTAVLKPSAYSPATSDLIGEIISECFAPEYVAVIKGGRQENSALLGEKFDYIFFTGSKMVGREVMRSAAENLTPVTLELGGKSPCIVEKSAKLKLAAKRIVFGKYLNCGQTCVAPDYILCDEHIQDALIAEIIKQIKVQFSDDPLENADYGRIVNKKHFERINGLIDPDKVVYGGDSDEQKLKIAPTVMRDVTFDDPIMQEEIFGPVLPVLTYKSLPDAVRKINSMASPLALYIFTEDKKAAAYVTSRCRYGGGCINDTIIHLATSSMPFGGVGESGMGGYHGRDGFDAFSHKKSIVDKKTFMDLPMRYQPYRKVYNEVIRLFLR